MRFLGGLLLIFTGALLTAIVTIHRVNEFNGFVGWILGIFYIVLGIVDITTYVNHNDLEELKSKLDKLEAKLNESDSKSN